jgi:Uma2 family endonuclease
MQLSSLDRSKSYTVTDYQMWDFPERVELINGKIYDLLPAPSPSHQEIAGDLYDPIKQFLKPKDCKVYFAPIDVYLPIGTANDTVLQPDICVVCDLSKITNKGCLGAPDLVAEILSPGNSAKEMKIKHEAYEKAGVKEYWVILPENLLFIAYLLVNGKFEQEPIKTIGDTITSSVLPGFSLLLSDLFKSVLGDKP